MAVGRLRPEPEQGHGSGISIGGNNIAPLQNVVGQNISNVHQSASVESPAVSMETVRDLLDAFRTEVDQNGSVLPNAQVLRAMADSIDTSLTASDSSAIGALHGAVQALSALVVAGTVVQQGVTRSLTPLPDGFAEVAAAPIPGWPIDDPGGRYRHRLTRQLAVRAAQARPAEPFRIHCCLNDRSMASPRFTVFSRFLSSFRSSGGAATRLGTGTRALLWQLKPHGIGQCRARCLEKWRGVTTWRLDRWQDRCL
ncbi:hypothetical protein AB0D11_36655 [Streptomyces monashensis]|uniref:hypothetical protein n=1 Tax=Streptomyces monashensis TaxID=1678012 RepID=UPI0033C90164